MPQYFAIRAFDRCIFFLSVSLYCVFNMPNAGAMDFPVTVEHEIANKAKLAAESILRQLEQKRFLSENSTTVICVLPVLDGYKKQTVLGQNLADVVIKNLLADDRVEVATAMSIGSSELRITGTIYQMEGRRIQIVFRCGNNPADPYNDQRYIASTEAGIILPNDPVVRAYFLSSPESPVPVAEKTGTVI